MNTFNCNAPKATVLLAAMIVTVTSVTPAMAQFNPGRAFRPQDVIRDVDRGLRDIDKARLDVMSRDPRPGRDYRKVYLQNTTAVPISVAILYYPFDFGRGKISELKQYTGSDGWVTRAWYKLAPGQRIHVANTANPQFYYYAEGSGLTWAGTLTRNVYGRSLGFRGTLISPGVEEWTLRINR